MDFDTKIRAYFALCRADATKTIHRFVFQNLDDLEFVFVVRFHQMLLKAFDEERDKVRSANRPSGRTRFESDGGRKARGAGPLRSSRHKAAKAASKKNKGS